jgi:hypothetical protein
VDEVVVGAADVSGSGVVDGVGDGGVGDAQAATVPTVPRTRPPRTARRVMSRGSTGPSINRE